MCESSHIAADGHVTGGTEFVTLAIEVVTLASL